MVLTKWPTVFTYEGPQICVSATSSNAFPVYRFYNVRTSSHFYTSSDAEREMVRRTWPNVFRDEGVGFYVGN
jgi:lysyl endopeptidase